jgi:hypothetical protein
MLLNDPDDDDEWESMKNMYIEIGASARHLKRWTDDQFRAFSFYIYLSNAVVYFYLLPELVTITFFVRSDPIRSKFKICYPIR